MQLFRKFFETDAPPAAAPASATQPVDLASLAASSGRFVQPREGQEPLIRERKQAEPPASQAAPVTTNAPSKTGTATQESQPPAAAKPDVKPQTEVAPAPAVSWQEVLKQQQPDTILKELGYGESLAKFLNGRKDLDPKVLGFIDHWEKNNGVDSKYLAALSTDYSKMPPEEVMRHHLKEQYPELDGKQLDRLYKLKVTDRYKLDPVNYSEEEVSDGQIELMADAKPIRAQLIQSQQDYILPKPEPKAPQTDLQAQKEQEAQQNLEAYNAQLMGNDYTKKIFENKKLAIGEGEDAYLKDVDPQALVDSLLYPDKWVANFYTAITMPDGKIEYKPDIEKQILIAAFSKDPKGFLKDYAKHFKDLGGKSAIAPIDNAKPPEGQQPAKTEVMPTDPAAAAAKFGRYNPGGG